MTSLPNSLSPISPLLESGEIEITHRLIDASNATLFGTIEGFGKVIYKPIAGERPLWDFPEGSLADREVAAFKLSDLFRFDLVPATVLRGGPFGPGMVQQWIATDPDFDVIAFGQGQDRQLRTMALFDAIINNTDRKFGHLLIDSSGKLFGCDHGVTFHQDDKLRTVLWQFAGSRYSEEEFAFLAQIASEASVIKEVLQTHLIDPEIEALIVRINRLLQAQVFPHPSQEWPAVPWPPV